MTRAVFTPLSLISSFAFAHPGHGAQEPHAHLWNAGLIAVGILAVCGIVYFLGRKK